jgi:CBS domain-containing protein
MTRGVIIARENDSVVDVAHLISGNRIHAVPIVDDRDRLLGIVAESDFFTKNTDDIYLPSYIELLQKLKFSDMAGVEEKEELRTLLLAKAGDIMTKDCATIGSEEDVSVFLGMIRSTGYSSIPVVDEERRLIGIVTTKDAIDHLVVA